MEEAKPKKGRKSRKEVTFHGPVQGPIMGEHNTITQQFYDRTGRDGNTRLTLAHDLYLESFKLGDSAAATFPYVLTPIQTAYTYVMQALHEAGEAIAPAKHGVLVVGESNAGKTRLALETLRDALPSWPVLVWRPDYTKEDIPPIEFLNGKRLVLFLDDLQEYAAGQMRNSSDQLSISAPHAMTLRTLSETLLQATQRIIIIATCRTENQAQTQIALGWLFVQLTTVEISSYIRNAQDPKVIQTITEFEKRGTIHIEDWDGTLGSLVLGLSTKNSQYLALPSHAKSVLRAMKLLSLALTTVHTEQRIRAVCAGIFAEKRVLEDEQVWQEAVSLLIQVQFVKEEVNESSLKMILAIRKDAYFERVVTDYPQPQRPYQLIRDLLQLGKVLKALEDAQALFDLGISLIELEREEEALAVFEQELALDPNNVEAWLNKGFALRLLERYEEALADFDRVITLDDKNARGFALRGMIYLQLKRYPEALADFDRALALDDKNAWTLARRGETYRLMERYPEALADFDRAIALDDKNASSLARRGLTYRLMERYPEAIADFDRAIALDDKNASSLARRGLIYFQLKRYQEALADFDRAIALDNKNASSLAHRGETYLQMERYQEALADFDRAIALGEKYAWALARRGETYLQMERYPEALADFDRAIALDEKDDWHRYRRAQIHFLVGKNKDFENDLHAAIELARSSLHSTPDDWRIGFNLALYNLVAGNSEYAESLYDQLASRCSYLPALQGAVNDLTNYLRIQPSNTLVQYIRDQIQIRISDLKLSPTE
jgi:tetratricopeptide (TPR) repeat protein